jgi:hypothetical protein
MKRLLLLLCLPLLFVGCGSSNNPADAGGRPIANETFTVPGGTFRQFSFVLDADVQRNAFLQGTVEVENGSIDMAVMDENNFLIWQTGNTPAVLYSPGLTPSASFRLPIDASDTYYLVFSNETSTDARTIKTEIFLFSTVDQGEL